MARIGKSYLQYSFDSQWCVLKLSIENCAVWVVGLDTTYCELIVHSSSDLIDGSVNGPLVVHIPFMEIFYLVLVCFVDRDKMILCYLS